MVMLCGRWITGKRLATLEKTIAIDTQSSP